MALGVEHRIACQAGQRITQLVDELGFAVHASRALGTLAGSSAPVASLAAAVLAHLQSVLQPHG